MVKGQITKVISMQCMLCLESFANSDILSELHIKFACDLSTLSSILKRKISLASKCVEWLPIEPTNATNEDEIFLRE